jgi:hypothetical protein
MAIQSSVSVPSVAVAGQAADSEHDILSGMLSSRKLVSVAVSAVNSFLYTVTVNGVVCSYTSDGSATTIEVATNLVAAINTSSQSGVVTAVGTDTPFTIESDVDVDFTTAYSANLTETVVVAHQQTAPAGVFVCID